MIRPFPAKSFLVLDRIISSVHFGVFHSYYYGGDPSSIVSAKRRRAVSDAEVSGTVVYEYVYGTGPRALHGLALAESESHLFALVCSYEVLVS